MKRLLLAEALMLGTPAHAADFIQVWDVPELGGNSFGFREDVWDAMDYELGAGPLPPGYWDKVGIDNDAVKRGANPVFDPISRRLAASKPAG